MAKIIIRIKAIFDKVLKTDIVKVFSLTSISTLVKMLTSLVSVKVVASIIGPAGVALVGQLNNFSSIIMSLSSGGINNGITKFVSEYKENKKEVKDYLSTALRITIICSLIVGLIMILFHSFWSEWIMLSPEYGYVFVIFGFTVLLYAINMMLTSIINGFKEFKLYVKVNIANSIFGLIFTLTFVLTWGLKGALISAVTFQSVMLVVTYWMVRKLPWAGIGYFKERFNSTIFRKYLKYTLMTFVSAATVPVSQMILRGYIISEISPVEAGWWEGMNRISNMYLMVITSSFSVYYLPRLSEMSNKVELRREIFKAYKVIVPTLLGGLYFIYFFRDFVVRLLYTQDFLPMTELFMWQLIGDFFKICSWLLAFLMVAKSMAKEYVLTEIIFAISYVGLGLLFMSRNAVVGITQGYMVNYIFYFICMLIMFKKILLAK